MRVLYFKLVVFILDEFASTAFRVRIGTTSMVETIFRRRLQLFKTFEKFNMLDSRAQRCDEDVCGLDLVVF